jgi:uncharacterized protein YdhG (YjbR/CyaY superfamily)
MDGIEEYGLAFPKKVQTILKKLRRIVKKSAPDAVEGMSYGMPGYKTNGKPLIYFAAYKNHIGLYATPKGHEAFAKELAKFKQGKGSVQFPLDEPMPYDLIERIVALRVKQNAEKAGK